MAQKVFGITFGKKDELDGLPKVKAKTTGTVVFGITLPFGGEPIETEELNESLAINFVPRLPAINVVPEAITNKYEEKDLIKKFVKAGIGVGVVIALMFGFSTFGELGHQGNLTNLTSEGKKLQDQATALAPYQTYLNSTKTKVEALASIMTTDVDIQKIVETTFSNASAQGIALTNMDVKILSGGTGDCVATDPFKSTSVIGCVKLSGNQPSAESVNAFFAGMGKTEGFTDGFINNTSYGDKNTFSGSFAFTAQLYSNKYNNLVLPIDTLITSGLKTPVASDPASTATPTASATPSASPSNSSTPAPTGSATPAPTTTPAPGGN